MQRIPQSVRLAVVVVFLVAAVCISTDKNINGIKATFPALQTVPRAIIVLVATTPITAVAVFFLLLLRWLILDFLQERRNTRNELPEAFRRLMLANDRIYSGSVHKGRLVLEFTKERMHLANVLGELGAALPDHMTLMAWLDKFTRAIQSCGCDTRAFARTQFIEFMERAGYKPRQNTPDQRDGGKACARGFMENFIFCLVAQCSLPAPPEGGYQAWCLRAQNSYGLEENKEVVH